MDHGKDILNALSVDVEDYFHVSAFSTTISPSSWDQYDCRVEQNTLKLLELFQHCETRATFFILGWIAKRYPSLVQTIHRQGHEVASHGHAHQTLDAMTPKAFRDEIRSDKSLLEDLIQAPVLGYRAPSFSITRRTTWALEILCQEGYRYDSSVFPVYHDRYGLPDAPRFPHDIAFNGRTLREFPPSTLALFGLPNIPIGGGGYLRLYPVWVTKWGFHRINQREHRPVMMYLHPWEVDPDQPRIPAGWWSRWRHYQNLKQTSERVELLLREFRFAPLRTVLGISGDDLASSIGPEEIRGGVRLVQDGLLSD